MTRWLEPWAGAPAADLQAAAEGRPLIAQILAQRGLTDPSAVRAFLDPQQYAPASSLELPDMEPAAVRLAQAIDQGQTIGVWGDFDVDGQTATTLLVEALRSLGATVIYHIPVRADEGHGVNLPGLQRLLGQGIDLLLTCDTGVAAHDAVAFARGQGVDVLITDHHDLPAALPDAHAVVNPKRLPPTHPLRELPGVGVAYKVVEELLRRFGRSETSRQYLDLTALGIVADLATLTGDTRYLLQLGLAELRRTPRLGLQALLRNAEINPEHLNEEHIAFALAPRLNALGRLGDANPIVEFLTTADLGRARVLATQLEGLNAQRQLLTSQVFQAALAQIERDPSLAEQAAIVLAHPAWPAGVIGIVASQLVERFRRPTVLIAAPPGELARGSARSVEGCNITAAIAAQADLLAGFGGHPMAAGLAIAPERIPEFRRRLAQTVQSMLGDTPAEPVLAIDGYLSLPDLSFDLVIDLERLAPFGPGNPSPILATRDLHLVSQKQVGRAKEHRVLTVADADGNTQEVIWWDAANWPAPEGRFDLAYEARASTYRGQPGVQIVWRDARPIIEAPVELRPSIQVVDHRYSADALAVLRALRSDVDVIVWREGDAAEAIDGYDRYTLPTCAHLAIWTTPPGRSELQTVLQRVQPRVVYLFGVDPQAAGLDAFLQRLAGLTKHALRANAGQTTVAALAAATAQRESTVCLGLDWLAERGHLSLTYRADGAVQLAPGSGSGGARLREIAAQLKAALAEAAAYRAFFSRCEAQVLVT